MLLSRRNAFHAIVASGASALTSKEALASVQPPELVRNELMVVNVKTFGAIGDGAVDDTAAIQGAVDECFGNAENPHSTPRAHLNKPLYFPPGVYKTTAPILLTNVKGGHVFGAGRFATSIKNAAGSSVFKTNGFEYSRVEMMRLMSAGNKADVFDLDWTNGGGTALQSNTFTDVFLDGGAIGINIGKSGFMGSENLFLNCFFGPCAIAGVKISNFNALQNTLVGGNIQSCPIGVWVGAGSCSVYNTGFQLCNKFDIVVNNSANDTMIISGVRSESPNFVQLRNGVIAHIVGCSHLSSANGVFSDIGNSQATIESCVSLAGSTKGDGRVTVSNTSFGRSDWIDIGSIGSGFYEVQNCFVSGTRNSSPHTARFIGRKTVTSAGTKWPSNRQSIAIEPGAGTARMPIAAGTRIQRVTLVLDTAGSAGVVRAGDSADPNRYFNGADLTRSTVVSSTVERKYAAADTLVVERKDATGVVGHIAVDFVLEN